ncbi:MAG: cbb3-type cytochrome c oxidase subunit II [Verrucomicrobiia bacterium]
MGVAVVFGIAWLATVAVPYTKFVQLQPVVDEETGDRTPPVESGLVRRGAMVYAAQGCAGCHSQRIRGGGADIDRGWGVRQSVPRDYWESGPVFWGSSRIGPDLSNVGVRQPSAMWHYQHLYNPRSLNPDSIMPPFRYLFEERKIVGQVSEDAVALFGKDAPKPGYEVVPTMDAKALVAYLLSRNQSYALPEAPVKEEKQEAQTAGSKP